MSRLFPRAGAKSEQPVPALTHRHRYQRTGASAVNAVPPASRGRPLLPEEEAVDDPDDVDDEIDDLLPADLWFHHPARP